MGGQLNRRMGEKAAVETALEGKAKYSVELRAYEEACKTDTDVRNFDGVLKESTGRVIHALANGVEVQSLSLESLREVTTCLLEMDQEVVKVILEYKKDIWNSPDLFELVQEYFDNSLQTLDFCTVLENCLRKARDNQLIMQIALQHFPAEDGGFPGEAEYNKVLKELGNFKNAGSPFADDFFSHFDAVYRRHVQMLEKLHARRSKLDRKLKHVKAWQKISSIIFVAAFTTVLICTVVAACVAAPPVAAALGVAATIPFPVGKWVNSLWGKYEDSIRGQREVISAMHVGTFVAIKDLDTIRVLVDRLESTISSMVKSVEFSLEDRDAVLIGIQDIKQKQESFMNNMEDLFKHVDRCSRDIRQARTLVVLKIIKGVEPWTSERQKLDNARLNQ